MEKENKICGRIVTKILCRLDSPLLIGSGEDRRTDSDVLVTADGIPLIPGSAMAGGMRAYLEETAGRQEAEDLFGTLGWVQQTEAERETAKLVPDYQSRIFVYDALLPNRGVIHRDGVRLDERKTSKEYMKFDMEAVETGADFCIRLEVCIREKNAEKDINAAIERDLGRIRCIVSGIESGALRLGARRNRGFGKLKILWGGYRVFQMDCRCDFEAWLDWNWGDESAFSQKEKKDWNELKLLKNEKGHCLEIPLRIQGTLLIRKYGAHAWDKETNEKAKDEIAVDYGQLLLEDGTAVIPGSTWAGAIRSYVAGLVRQIAGFDTWEQAQKALEVFWGTWAPGEEKKQEKLWASKVIMDETPIIGGHYLPVRRTAVDRFTGGAAKGALFSEGLWAGGKVNLTIRWSDRGLPPGGSEALCGMLLWAIQGIKDGLLAVGGETGVGRGIFEPAGNVYLNGQPMQEEKPYLLAAAQWCRKRREA